MLLERKHVSDFDQVLKEIDFRHSVDPVGVINEPWQAPHSKAKPIWVEKMLLEWKHVSYFDRFLKEIDFSNAP